MPLGGHRLQDDREGLVSRGEREPMSGGELFVGLRTPHQIR
jgi:hypothetical protein